MKTSNRSCPLRRGVFELKSETLTDDGKRGPVKLVTGPLRKEVARKGFSVLASPSSVERNKAEGGHAPNDHGGGFRNGHVNLVDRIVAVWSAFDVDENSFNVGWVDTDEPV